MAARIDWIALALATASSVVATIGGGWILNRIEGRQARGSAPGSAPLAPARHDLGLTRALPWPMWPALVAIGYVTFRTVSYWAVSPLHSAGLILVTGVVVGALPLTKQTLLRRAQRGRMYWGPAQRLAADVLSLSLLLAGLILVEHVMQDDLTLELPDEVGETQILSGHVKDARAAVFVMIRPAEASGNTTYTALRPDARGAWTATVSFAGPTGTRFLVWAVALDPYAVEILGDPAALPSERLDRVASLRSRTHTVSKLATPAY